MSSQKGYASVAEAAVLVREIADRVLEAVERMSSKEDDTDDESDGPDDRDHVDIRRMIVRIPLGQGAAVEGETFFEGGIDFALLKPRLFIVAADANSGVVRDVYIGKYSQFANQGSIPFSLLAADHPTLRFELSDWEPEDKLKVDVFIAPQGADRVAVFVEGYVEG